MTDVTLYHNPRCSKSREALALLETRGANIHQVRYLDSPLTAAEITHLIDQLGVPAHDLLRTNEPEYKAAGLSPTSSKAVILVALVQYPKLLQRPIAVVGNRAVIGRPPEKVLDLL